MVGENEFIGLGQMQNIGISLGYPITVHKNYWDKISLGMVKESQEASKSSEVAAVLMEEGQANLYCIKNNFSIHKGCVQKS